MKPLGIFLLILIAACTNAEQKKTLKDTGVIESYKPKDKIDFPHDIHIKNNMECNYCHNEKTRKDKHELTVNICARCHLKITGAGADTVK